MTNILLVEDDKMIVGNLSEFLQSEGFAVKNAPGQSEALSLLEKYQFDLVLLDVSLSNGNGFALCKAIKTDYNIPVIFLTASGDEYSTVAGFEIGADDYIPKPFRPRELAMRIRNVLRLTGGSGTLIHIGDITVDTIKGTARKNGRDL